MLATGAVIFIVLVAAIGSYYYHSATTATTFLQLATAADEGEDFEGQAKWLRRYSLLVPDDVDAIYQMAIAADKAADAADRDSRGARVDAARRALSRAIGQIGDKDDDKVADLRVRMLNRLLQLGGPWNREAERQIIELDADENDPQSLAWLALALGGEIADGSYSIRAPQAKAKADGYWAWLANQSPAFVLGSALQENPQNLDLITQFLFTRRENPELFQGPRGGATLPDSELEAIEKRAAKTIGETPTSHAQLVYYRYLLQSDDADEAGAVIRRAAESAHQRLVETSSGKTPENPDWGGRAQEPASSLVTSNPMPAAYWDFLAVYDAALLETETDADHALDRMQFLSTLDVPSVSRRLLENLSFEYGKLLVSQDRADEALTEWNSAIQNLAANSILLPRAIASVHASQENWEAAEQAAQQLADAIDASEKLLARTPDAQIARSERIVEGRRLAAARWQLNVLKSYIAAGQGDQIEAIGLLQSVVDSDADITPRDRVDALIHLASYHANQGTWDAAATTFEKAVVLDPDNVQLRQLTSEAWSRSGNQVNSLRQLDLIDTDSSLPGAIAETEARFAFQLQLPPQQQNFRQVRDAVAQLKRQIEQRLQAPAEASETSEISDADLATLQSSLRSSQRYLDAFEWMIPPDNVAAETHLHSTELAHRIDEFAKEHPEEANLQALAAERLAQAKLESDAMAAMQRLAKLDNRGGVSELRVRARTLSALGRNAEAAKLLIDAALAGQESEALVAANADALTLLQDAAVFASRGQDNSLAYRALTAIPDEQRSLQTLSAICQLAGTLPADSEFLTLDDTAVSAQDLYEHWFDVLQKREGDAGTYWRYLRANALLDQVHQGSMGAAADDPKLAEARQLAEAIVSIRPRWGDAIAMQGRISALAGDAESAVTQLRRGIASGSSGLPTRQLLWQQLIALGRTEEAEQEIQIAEINAGGQSDRFSATLIDLALRQGDYSKSMEVAKESAKNHPDNVNAQLVVAATGTTALANVTDQSDRDDLIEQIRSSISLAAKLSGPDDPRVLAANLRLAITLQDDEQIDSLIGDIEAGDLAEPAQNQLLSQAYLAQESYDQALTLLLRADELDPTSNSQLRLAEIYRRLDRPRDEIMALRSALQRDQTNDRLRNLLAQKLVARSAEGQPVDWQAIGDLLAGSGGGATSNQVMHAILLGSEAMRELNSDAQSQPARLRLNQSKMILRGLVKKQSGDWKTPTRYLASLLQQEPNVSPDLSQPERARINTEIRSLYQGLINDSTVEASDVYQYASYLLNQTESGDDATIKNLVQKLNSLASNSLQALEVSVRFADRQGSQDKTPSLVEQWANNALGNVTSASVATPSDQDALKELMVMAAAGNSLQKLGFTEDSVQWFERAYREFPTQALGPYIVALGQVKKFEEAVTVCAEHYAEHHDAQSATLLVEVLLNYRDSAEQAAKIRAHDSVLTDASERYQTNAGFLEGLGTLKMAEGRYDQAVKCFVSVLKVNPKSIRSLNNLAMSYAEIPELASQGLDPINSALLLTNQNPELLDTKGVVLMASGRLAEAEATFAEAYAASREPRHLFHVILAQINQRKESQAAQNWKDLDLEKLDPTGLTANERVTLEELKTKFTSAS